MALDMTPYTSVTPEFEEAERTTFLEGLDGALESERSTALVWLEHFQTLRSIMHLVMGGLVQPGIEDGELGFQLVSNIDEAAMKRIEKAGLFADNDPKEKGDPSLN